MAGSKIYTKSGKWFDYSAPSPEMICVEDIAHALSRQPRFLGHTATSWTVAHHSVTICRVAQRLYPGDDRIARHALMHDATEAYCCDLPTPLKRLLPGYRLMEQTIWREAIAPALGLEADLPDEVKHLDNRMLATEMQQLLPDLGDPSFYIGALKDVYLFDMWRRPGLTADLMLDLWKDLNDFADVEIGEQ